MPSTPSSPKKRKEKRFYGLRIPSLFVLALFHIPRPSRTHALMRKQLDKDVRDYAARLYDVLDGDNPLFKLCMLGDDDGVRLMLCYSRCISEGDLLKEYNTDYLITASGTKTKIHEKAVMLTPLEVSCEFGFLEVVRTLLAAGIDANGGDGRPFRPLHWACRKRNGNSPVISLLLSYGADPNALGHLGKTPLHMACLNRSVESATVLLSAGCDPDRVDVRMTTALYIAVYQNDINMVKLLLKYRCNTDVGDVYGMTPLHLACKGEVEDIAQVLISAGARTVVYTRRGTTPFQLCGRPDMAERLRLYASTHAPPPPLTASTSSTPRITR